MSLLSHYLSSVNLHPNKLKLTLNLVQIVLMVLLLPSVVVLWRRDALTMLFLQRKHLFGGLSRS